MEVSARDGRVEVAMTSDRMLVLLRHAKSDWSTTHHVDAERPLAHRGRHQAPEAGRWLAGHLKRIDLAVVSPARRAVETWELASRELPEPPPVLVDDRVYAASDEQLLEVVHGLPDDAHIVVVVGHNPGLEELVELLAGEWVALPTSALAVLELEGPWSTAEPCTASLHSSGRPPRD